MPARQHIDSHATEAFGGMRVVRSFSRQRTESGHFVRNNQLMIRQELLAWWWMRGIELVWAMLIPLASAVLLWYGGMRILDDMARVQAGTLALKDAFTVGDLVMFLGYLVALLSPLETLAESATGIQNNLAGLDRVLDLLAEPTEMPARPGAVAVHRGSVRGRITLRHVSFAYPGSTTLVLQRCQPGGRSRRDGRPGRPQRRGQNHALQSHRPVLRSDGRGDRAGRRRPARHRGGELPPAARHRRAGHVPVRRHDRRQHRLRPPRRRSCRRSKQAARLANAHEFITAMKDGYETLIGERGVKLSGGQRQRIAIARALLADPRILILDEATSNLDTQSERLIQAGLQTLMADRTSFVIAHRLSTIVHADRIVVLDHGRVVEQGTHDDLMSRSGRYRQMVEMQTQPIPGSPVPLPRIELRDEEP